MKLATLRSSLFAVCAASLVAVSPAALAQSEQQKLVNEATTTFNNFVRDPDMTWFQKNAGRAKGFLIAPQVAKAGFIFGGSGGRAVLVVRNPKTGSWSGPVFYVLATASVGFQAGISVSEVVTMVMTEKGINSLLSTSVKLGGDASIAAGPVGVGAQGEVITDMVSFARAKGVFGGLNLDGTAVTISDDWNQAYFKKNVLPPDIVITGSVKNAAAAPLLSAVAKAAGGK
jgi:lipid-binding SYLF domain-containing protein